MIYCQRVFDPKGAGDGTHFLVERLWPRGARKDQLQLDDWLKELAPSDTLRRWFGHDPDKWNKFRHRDHADRCQAGDGSSAAAILLALCAACARCPGAY
jgi:uncharacterized protein YeaO (DUF488 family)